jgi:hypothetical protein
MAPTMSDLGHERQNSEESITTPSQPGIAGWRRAGRPARFDDQGVLGRPGPGRSPATTGRVGACTTPGRRLASRYMEGF